MNDRLARAVAYPVTLIVAPAGFGKSVALRDFVETSRLDAVRYNVSRDDSTLLTFVRRLSEALAPVAPSARAAFAPMEHRIRTSDNELRDLNDWLAEHLRRTVCTIVLDDLHYADPSAVALLVALIERTSDRIKWILASRSDAGIPIASWVAYGRMDLPVGEDDLRFTYDEALAAADEAQTGIASDEVEELRSLTAGWPVALAIALRTRTYSDDLRSASSGTREMVYRYLAEQVFAGLTPDERDFVLKTSVFSAFDVGVGEALGYSHDFIAGIRRKVNFVSAVSPGEYRYHDLFREFLEDELRSRGHSSWHKALVEGAAILEARGHDAEALALYTRARSTEGILHVIGRSGLELFERGWGDGLAAALEALPESARGASAMALGLGAMLEAASGRFTFAERSFTSAIAAAEASDLRVALVHRYAIELVRHDRDCVEVVWPYANDDTLEARWRVPMLGTLATSLVRAGRLEEALSTIQRAMDLLDRCSDGVRARLYQQAAYVNQFGPSPQQARLLAERAVALASSENLYEIASRAYSILYTIAYEDDDPIALLGILDKLGECARKGGSNQATLFGLIATYEIEAERGNEVELERLDRAIGQDAGALPQTRTESLLPAVALRAAWSGDFRRAYELLAGTAQHQRAGDREAMRWAEIALYGVAAGLDDEAENALREAAAALTRAGLSTRRALRTALILGLTELVRGHMQTAHRHIADAERRIDPGMRRLRAMAHAMRALYRVQSQQAEQAAVTAALERLRAEHFGGLARLVEALPFAADRGGYAALTGAERSILRLLVKGASSKEVAAQTARSPQTVDTHIRSICRKLQCSGRREVVALAVSAGWVE